MNETTITRISAAMAQTHTRSSFAVANVLNSSNIAPHYELDNPMSISAIHAIDQSTYDNDEDAIDQFTWAQLWKSFNVIEIERLRSAFHQGEDRQLNVYEFVNAVRELAMSKKIPEDKLHLVVRELTELFSRIDVNGDGQMTWDEFTAFIVDNADAVLGDAAPPRMLLYPPVQYDRPHIELCDKIFHFPGINKFLACRLDGTIHVCDGNDYKAIRVFKAHEGAILSAVHVPSRHCIITSSIDRSMIMWNENTFSKEAFIPTPSWILCFTHSKIYGTLYGGSTDGSLFKFDFQNQFKIIAKLPLHSDWITDMAEIPELGLTLSSSLDKKILVWETATCVRRNELNGHKKGVLCMAYSQRYRLVFSAGFDRDVLVWNPIVAGVLHKMKGHDKTIMSLYATKRNNELISLDTSGRLKLWDIRSYECLQTLDYKKIAFNTTCFDREHERLITADHTWYTWRFSDTNEEVTSWPIVAAKYNHAFNTIVVASTNADVTIWNAFNGELVSSFDHVADAEVTALQIHPLGRQILVGFQNGLVVLLNYTTGGIVRKFLAHTSEVMHIFYLNRTDIALGTLDAKVKIFSTDMIAETVSTSSLAETLREWKCMVPDITCVEYRPELGHIIVCGGSAFEVWKITGLMVMHRDQPEDHDYTACTLAENVGLFLTANVNHEIELWMLPKYQLLYTVSLGNFPNLQHFVYCPDTKQLITDGEKERTVCVWDVEAMMNSDPDSVGYPKNDIKVSRTRRQPDSRETKSFFMTSLPLAAAQEESVNVTNAWFKIGDDLITSVSVAPNPPAIIAGSFDGRVRLVSMTGSTYGSLTQNRRAVWGYPINVEETNRTQVLEAQHTLQVCDSMLATDGPPRKTPEPDDGRISPREIRMNVNMFLGVNCFIANLFFPSFFLLFSCFSCFFFPKKNPFPVVILY
eukprot:TRINITY_DN10569_c0_g1_i5.p1 TRINITY_DN10569_c0_g1~~TRINITY_DN10569_c0_g1_i5.p1  ORF type:complete len:919 (+),score=138.32 TRINITY_DN10569_c0_g1_i5:188-2944(+)